MNQPSEVKHKLEQAGLLQPSGDDLAPESPWYVKALLGFSGWLAAFFLLGFLAVGVAWIYDSATASLVVGVILIAIASGLLRLNPNDFVEQLALALSLTGQLLVAFALLQWFDNLGAVFWFCLAVLQCLLVPLMASFPHRVFSSFAGASALSLALVELGLHYLPSGLLLLACMWVWWNEFRFPAHVRLMQALGYGLALALLTIEQLGIQSAQIDWQIWRDESVTVLAPSWMSGPAIATLFAAATAAWLLKMIFNRQPADRRIQLTAYAIGLLLALASLWAHGLLQATLLLVLGFAVGNRLLQGLGVAALLFAISHYYYLLDLSLLEKSLTLLLLGLFMLAARWPLRFFQSEETSS